jgi:hypothetical protein
MQRRRKPPGPIEFPDGLSAHGSACRRMNALPTRSQTDGLPSTIKFRSVEQDVGIRIDHRRERGASHLAPRQKAWPARRYRPTPSAKGRTATRDVDAVDIHLDVCGFSSTDESRQAKETNPFSPPAFDFDPILARGERHRKIGIAMQEPRFIVEASVLKSRDAQCHAPIGARRNPDRHGNAGNGAANGDEFAGDVDHPPAIVRPRIEGLEASALRSIG